MKRREYDCPVCGASLTVREGQNMISCPSCGNSVIVPDSFSSDYSSNNTEQGTSRRFQKYPASHRDVWFPVRVIAILSITSLLGVTGYYVYPSIVSHNAKDASDGGATGTTLEESLFPVVLEFGGTGIGAGYFQDACNICVDPQGNTIYVGEMDAGTIEMFDGDGTYLGHWSYGEPGECFLESMALSEDGLLCLVNSGKLCVYKADTGELVDSLEHPEEWDGFDSVDFCDDGGVVATWYVNRDDMIKFAPDGGIDFILQEAISGQSGDSETITSVKVDNAGNIFVYAANNESFFKFSPDGHYLNRFGSRGDNPGQFTLVTCFCVGPRGMLWVDDFGDLVLFDNNGTYINRFEAELYLEDMVILNGYQLFGITDENKVIQVDLSTIASNL